MPKDMIINYSPHEARVAVMENGLVSELYYERLKEKGIVGNIYKGKVLKVLPGMEAAFVEIGVERAAFLYIDDVLEDNSVIDEEGRRPRSGRDPKIKIERLLKEGQEILVQVSKGPIGTKGARITSHISIPGRNLVYMPTVKTLGVSRQITSYDERQRLKEIVNRLRPEKSGFIIRTVAEGRSEDDLRSDLNYLVSTWDEIQRHHQERQAPALLHSDLHVVFRSIRDILSPEIRRLIIDDKEQYKNIKKFLNTYLPRYRSVLEYFTKDVPIFDHYGIEAEIERALGQKVWLKSGGYLVIDQTEALTAIDVNTGRFVGQESHEQTILKTNLEAVEELVCQLQLRNIGGIIIIDLIDMELSEHRQKVYNALKEQLKHDKTRSKILQISEMGLVEMTRKRDRENLARYLCDPCPYCEGKGRLKSASTVSYEIFRELYRSQQKKGNGSYVVHVHPDVYEYLGAETNTLNEIEKDLGQKITFKMSNNLHHEQFELYQY
ncbi:MAG: Rne/Rng family ribonuclease [SAR324 cluster bacterium]|nr:Rne/Rng family ribonuclease [SAR324 cluster bacterium]